MKCPNCKETNLVISERSGIEIDYCPDCRGIWLDRGELDKIIEKANFQARDEEQRYRGQQSQGYSQNDYYKHKRKKSIWEEIFD